MAPSTFSNVSGAAHNFSQNIFFITQIGMLLGRCRLFTDLASMKLLSQAVIVLLITDISCGVFSCGGFVRSSVSSILQKVKVQFLSEEGHLKYETACNPTNGYYMIPVYTRGIYRIRVVGPDGFIFDPSERVVNINNEDNDCASGKDINFHLSAFQVTGKILSGKGSGPSKLELGLYTEQGQQIATTTTDNKGLYSFKAVPGKYVVSTLEHTNQCVERGSVPVEVVDKPVVVSTDLKISGQNLNVAVVSQSKEPIGDVEVSLFSDVSIPFEKQVNAQRPVSARAGNGYVYSLKTSNQGLVTFSCLPPGAFRVKASLKTQKGTLVFRPEEKLVTINSKLEEVGFESAGFTLTGKVIHGSKPLANVVVSLKKSNEKYERIGTTDKDGQFVAKGLTKGSYRVKAEKDRLRFDEKTFEVNSDGGEIEPIELLEVEICGQLIFDNPQKLRRSPFPIGIYDSENKRVSSLEVGSPDGKYCIYVRPGKYNVKPEFSLPVVYPKSLFVDLQSASVDNLVFTEFKAKVEGSVSCLDACSSVKVAIEQNGEAIQTLKITDNKFIFDDISPGSYKLAVYDNVGRCWEKEEYSLQVESKNIESIVIKQTGYTVVIDSAKRVKLTWNGVGSHGIVDLKPGKTRFCVPKKGVYNLNVESCYDFEEGKNFSKELPKDEIVLRVKTAIVGLNVKSSSKLNLKDVAVTVKSVSGERIVSSQQSETNNLYFEFGLGVEDSGSNVELIPSSKTLLFKPSSHSFNFDGECNPNLVTIEAFQGKYVEGSVEPALKDVGVKAVNKKSAETLFGKTDSYGRFKIGLVFDPSEYEVALEWEGYKFSKIGSNKFKAVKLSKLVIYYFDERTQEPLEEVLVSVSGGVDYRNNVIVDKSGRKSFVGVPAGEYFISSVLREYQFVPDQTSVSIKEGETVERKIYGKRFAYSAFGTVVAAGGLPLDQVAVQAVSESCGNLLEEDITDKEGQFRVRGLKPGCEYKLMAKSRNGQRVRAIPPFVNHEAKQEDLKSLEFTLVVATPQNQLLGVLKLNKLQRPKNLIVDLYEDGKKIASDNLGSTNNLFVFNDRLAEGKEYQVKISDKQLKGVNAVSTPVSFQVPQNGGLDLIKQVTLVVASLPKKAEIETSKSNILGFFFVIFVTVVCMNLNNSKDVALGLYDRAVELIRRESASTAEKRKKQKNN